MSRHEKNLVVVGSPALKLLDDTLVSGFLAGYGNGHTKRAYRNGLNVFRKWVAGLPEDHTPLNLLSEFKSFLESKAKNGKASGYSIGLYMAVVKKYVGMLHEKGLIEFDPAKSVKGIRRHSTHYRRALDRKTEMPRLLNAIDQTAFIGLRDYAIIALLAFTGIRAFELAAADYGDMDSIEGRPVLWVRSKGKLDKSEYAYITDTPHTALQAYLERRGSLISTSPLFLGTNGRSSDRLTVRAIQKRVDYWLRQAGLKSARVTTHSLRHTAAVAALKNGADIRAVQSMLRHSDPKTTMVYLRDISRQDKPAEDAVEYHLSD